ncbi:MAG TPA: hypothetical protein VGT40_10030 [Methylomirabilota bacterium]|nr:hypothetical protein [Methylomirabilota bacterium]
MGHRLAILLVVLAGVLWGCAISPEQREETIRVWAERDAERARECVQRGGGWVAAGCIRGGGP